MELYFAPFEGISGYLYRNAQAAFFPKADKYFSPFVSPGIKRRLTRREYKDTLPENNTTLRLVPQILTNSAEAFLQTTEELRGLGYTEVNLNLGCPSRTVVSKGRGAGFLGRPAELASFLDEIYEKAKVDISIKTRIGMADPAEFLPLLKLFNRHPATELIIHPRLQSDYYNNHPNLAVFGEALAAAKMPVVYNGDLFTAADVAAFCEKFPDVERLMLGRGVLANPALFGEVRGEGALTKEALFAFHQRLLADYEEHLYGDKVVLYKMKELWYYMHHSFEGGEKYLKKIRKAQRLAEYKMIVRGLFSEANLR